MDKTIAQEDIEKASVEYADKTAKQYEVCNSEFVQEIMVAFEQGANFVLGKQEKDAEGTSISERLYDEDKSRLEGLYHYLNRKADEQKDEYVSVAILFEAMERLEDMFGIDLLTHGHGKSTPKDADTVIQGWVCRDKKDNTLNLHAEKPYRSQSGYDVSEEPDWWESDCASFMPLDKTLFPDLTWESDPEEVEIIIKRKKK